MACKHLYDIKWRRRNGDHWVVAYQCRKCPYSYESKEFI